jgi:hypothetical protein
MGSSVTLKAATYPTVSILLILCVQADKEL